MATKKANVIAQSLFDKLKIRFGASALNLAVTAGQDASGNPTVSVGPGTAGGQNVFVRVIDQASLGTNGLGIAQESYGPHIIQVAVEESATAGETLVSLANLASVLWEVVPVGAKVELYKANNTVAPTVATLVAANLVVALDDLYWPQLGSM